MGCCFFKPARGLGCGLLQYCNVEVTMCVGPQALHCSWGSALIGGNVITTRIHATETTGSTRPLVNPPAPVSFRHVCSERGISAGRPSRLIDTLVRLRKGVARPWRNIRTYFVNIVCESENIHSAVLAIRIFFSPS